ncbi:hypothetical protein [Paenibacillus chungangensis]|uniref:Lipoprotein n=1 Tax=Paenibacillus chungangensis TaxID=696535 RepID=A0ABW3HRW0_9BACL
MYLKMITFLAAAAIMTACASNGEQIPNSQPKAEVSDPLNVSSSDGQYASLPEYDTIMKHLDEKDYSFNTVTDNEGTRILLIELDGAEQYKTIFVKHTNRLKIIQLDGDKQLYNDILVSQ